MEARAVPREAPAGVSGFVQPHVLRLASDARLVDLIREGRPGAFETAYARHHRGILSFCRHMLGDPQEAEDAVQQTFLAAYNDLLSSDKPIHLRAWLFTIARNRCYSMLRSRRERPTAELAEIATEGLAGQVQVRQDLRDLIRDMRRLPPDQRAALVLAEIDSLNHEQIAEVLGVQREKVKALVFQARESLLASRTARETDCAEIREQLATMHGGGLRRTNLRRHLHQCAGCREYRKQVERQRRRLALIIPVAPTLALKDAVIAGTIGTGAGILGGGIIGAGGGLLAASALKSSAAKTVMGLMLAGAGTAGTIVAARDLHEQLGGGSSALERLIGVNPAPLRSTPATMIQHASGRALPGSAAPRIRIVMSGSWGVGRTAGGKTSAPGSSLLDPFTPVVQSGPVLSVPRSVSVPRTVSGLGGPTIPGVTPGPAPAGVPTQPYAGGTGGPQSYGATPGAGSSTRVPAGGSAGPGARMPRSFRGTGQSGPSTGAGSSTSSSPAATTPAPGPTNYGGGSLTTAPPSGNREGPGSYSGGPSYGPGPSYAPGEHSYGGGPSGGHGEHSYGGPGPGAENGRR